MNQTAQEEGQMVTPECEKQWELLFRFLPKGPGLRPRLWWSACRQV